MSQYGGASYSPDFFQSDDELAEDLSTYGDHLSASVKRCGRLDGGGNWSDNIFALADTFGWRGNIGPYETSHPSPSPHGAFSPQGTLMYEQPSPTPEREPEPIDPNWLPTPSQWEAYDAQMREATVQMFGLPDGWKPTEPRDIRGAIDAAFASLGLDEE